MIAVLPASLTYTFGRMVEKPRQGWTIFWVMTLLFVVGLIVAGWAEQSVNPHIAALGVDMQASDFQPGGNMEGKELRFGVHGSVLAAVTTSNGATGSYNSMHDSYSPLGGMVPLVNMLLGELIYGGLGSGLYSMVMLVLVSVFVGGLMVGHTPQYLGKQVTIPETKLIVSYIVVGMATALPLTCIAVATVAGRGGLVTNQGAHGLTTILFAYASSLANNGQNFAGLNANSVFYNVTTAIAMLVGRFGLAAIALALAGCFAEQGLKPTSLGTLLTDTPTFAMLLTATIIILAGLSYLPALTLGPIIETFEVDRLAKRPIYFHQRRTTGPRSQRQYLYCLDHLGKGGRFHSVDAGRAGSVLVLVEHPLRRRDGPAAGGLVAKRSRHPNADRHGGKRPQHDEPARERREIGIACVMKFRAAAS